MTKDIFLAEYEQTAIERINKFARIADKLGYEMKLGFSGGKDSQVVHHLMMRSGKRFKSYFNHSFESPVTVNFIKQHYPDVIFRKDHKFGFIENIYKNHNGLLPTAEIAYCCQDYKHNPKYVDECSIVGVRRAESINRKDRKTFEAKNKTVLKRNKILFDNYFEENCQGSGNASIIQLKPIIDWTDDNVWEYIYKYDLPINPEYEHFKRIGCMVCPKTNLSSNFFYLMKYPKLINAFIKAREKGNLKIDWIITSENKDYSDNKVEYICRYLNYSFRPFSKKEKRLFEKIKRNYEQLKLNIS